MLAALSLSCTPPYCSRCIDPAPGTSNYAFGADSFDPLSVQISASISGVNLYVCLSDGVLKAALSPPLQIGYQSCVDWLQDEVVLGPATKASGLYTIWPGGQQKEVWCDMSLDGGGWELVSVIPTSGLTGFTTVTGADGGGLFGSEQCRDFSKRCLGHLNEHQVQSCPDYEMMISEVCLNLFIELACLAEAPCL